MPDQEIQLITGDALGALERSQIDVQISTAKRYPRSVKAFLTEAETMISLNQETAESCNYKLKRKEKGGGIKIIEGPSIRLLEIAAAAYTNLRYGSRIIGIDDDFVTAQGVAFDLEKNVAQTVETKRSIRTKEGLRYGSDMIMVTSNAAGSIARRNALNGLIPRAYVINLADYAKRIAVGDIKSLPERRQRAFDYFTKVLGVDAAKVLAYLEKAAIEDCGLAELEELQGLKTMLKEGEISMESAFDPQPNGDANAKVETPDLGKKEPPPQPGKVPGAPGTVKPAEAATPPVTPPPTTTTEGAATATRKKKKEPVAPVEPVASDEPGNPEPKPKEEPPPFIVLASRLDQHHVSIDDFFDWLKGSGRDRVYGFDVDKVNTMNELPAKLVTDLLTTEQQALASCIKMFGKPVAPVAPA